MRTYVVIPVKDEPNLACNVIATAAKEPDTCVWVFDNGSSNDTRTALEEFECETVGIHEAAGMGLYQMWDAAWSLAHLQAQGVSRNVEPYNIAFLNSDIDFASGTLQVLAAALRQAPMNLGCVCPDYNVRVGSLSESKAWESWSSCIKRVTGSYRHGGICGWCFMVQGELYGEGVRLDTSYEWWGGDDDLFFQIERAGYSLGIVTGLPLDHVGEATARHHPWTHEAKERDMARLRDRWGAR